MGSNALFGINGNLFQADTPKAAGADDEIALGDITEQNECTSEDQEEVSFAIYFFF